MKKTRHYCLFIFALVLFLFLGCATTKNQRTAIQEDAMEASTTQEIAGSLDAMSQQARDAKISSAIRMKFAGDRLLSDSEINVDTSSRNVTLKGKVGTQQEADRALHLGRSVDGVRSVHSELIVKSGKSK